MKKILFVIPTLAEGGAEKVLVNLVNNMNKKKYSITVLTLFNKGEHIRSLNENITHKYVFNKIFRGHQHFLKVFAPKTLYKLMIKEKYDIVVSYLQGPSTRIVSGCDDDSTLLINWVHNEFDDIKSLSKSYRSISETINSYQRYNGTVFVANTAKESFKKLLPLYDDKLKVLYNTVETEAIRKKSLENLEDQYFSTDKINIISAGRFVKQKGFERLIRVVSTLINVDKINIQLYLLGRGELEEEYKEIINKLKIVDNVTFLGYKKNPYKYVKNADLFVCSSYHEGFSTAVSEALIVETPVLTTNCSGMEELLGSQNEYGEIIGNSEDELYIGLKSIVREPKKIDELKSRAIKRGNFFNKYNTVEKVEEYIESLIIERHHKKY